MTAENQTTAKFPTHTVYYLKNKEGSEKPDWIKAGASWENSGRKGLNLSLTVLGQPISVVVCKNKPRET
ncbi:hypothetical protein Runsl_5287 [Runella slithyformis DSM 19594]|uniref:Uncharacterized protein n=2 Tax=Runella TaxID=105 RepID=A0A7U4E8S7_RUNSL|nr:hypothetical protein Runsl_5287 [Runella slithyformis DSM 19594]